MEYREILNIVPGSYVWRTPSPGSQKPTDEAFFKWDYKTSYKSSPYFIRRYRPIPSEKAINYTNNTIEQKQIDKFTELHPSFKSKMIFYIKMIYRMFSLKINLLMVKL